MDSQNQRAYSPEKIMHRDELNTQLASLKAYRDGLLLDSLLSKFAG
jgi:hypothetical protein